MTLRFNKTMLQDGAQRMRAWLKKEQTYPNWLKMKDTNGKEHKLKPREYSGLYENVNLFLIKNGRYPNYATLDHNSSNPLVMDYQDYNYSCCAQSLSMASQLLWNYHSENECIKALGTAPKVGTSPDQLINNAPKLGFKIIPIERSAKAVRQHLSKKHPVICHFQTNQTKACKGDYIGTFGHYSLIWNITDTEYIVADPSKGVNRKYKFSCMNNANKGYRQNYYAVTLK